MSSPLLKVILKIHVNLTFFFYIICKSSSSSHKDVLFWKEKKKKWNYSKAGLHSWMFLAVRLPWCIYKMLEIQYSEQHIWCFKHSYQCHLSVADITIKTWECIQPNLQITSGYLKPSCSHACKVLYNEKLLFHFLETCFHLHRLWTKQSSDKSQMLGDQGGHLSPTEIPMSDILKNNLATLIVWTRWTQSWIVWLNQQLHQFFWT